MKEAVLPDDLECLKEHVPLLQYLARHDWRGRPVGSQQEFVGLCPLHAESKPSFYVNARKNVFYCHGCGRGGDIVRFVQLHRKLSFHKALVHLKQELALPESSPQEVLKESWAFYQSEFSRNFAGLYYLYTRGVRDTVLMGKMGIGYAPGRCLRRHLVQLGYPFDLLVQTGLISKTGHDTFFRRIVFPCFDQDQLVNLYGRSLDGDPIHRFLPFPKGGLFAWNAVRACPVVILVEGPLDAAVLWQAGFGNTTCGFGIHLSRRQLAQLCDGRVRKVFIAFDSDPNGAGQSAARFLAQRLAPVGLTAHIVDLPLGHDPNSYFVSGATAEDFQRCLDLAETMP
jgi:DNA primase